MGTIVKLGKGTLESRISLNGKKYMDSEDFEFKNYKICVQKTQNWPVNGNTFLDHWKFSYIDKEDSLKGYITGEPLNESIFHVHHVQSAKLKEMPNIIKLLDFSHHKILEKINRNHKNPYKKFQIERGLFFVWDFLKKYLKEEGFKEMITKADYRLYDTLKFDCKLGWIDQNRKRKIENYSNNPLERNKHLTILEKVLGLVELKYPLED